MSEVVIGDSCILINKYKERPCAEFFEIFHLMLIIWMNLSHWFRASQCCRSVSTFSNESEAHLSFGWTYVLKILVLWLFDAEYFVKNQMQSAHTPIVRVTVSIFFTACLSKKTDHVWAHFRSSVSMRIAYLIRGPHTVLKHEMTLTLYRRESLIYGVHHHGVHVLPALNKFN